MLDPLVSPRRRTPLREARHTVVTFPVIAPAVGAGFLFAWIRSFEDYIRALFLTGPNTDVLTIWMFSRIRQLDAPELNAVSSLIVFAVAIALAVAMNYGNVTGYVAGTATEDDEPE